MPQKNIYKTFSYGGERKKKDLWDTVEEEGNITQTKVPRNRGIWAKVSKSPFKALEDRTLSDLMKVMLHQLIKSKLIHTNLKTLMKSLIKGVAIFTIVLKIKTMYHYLLKAQLNHHQEFMEKCFLLKEKQ